MPQEELGSPNGDIIHDYNAYTTVLDHYANPRDTFHPTGIHDEQMFAAITDALPPDSLPVIPVDKAMGLVDPERCLTMARQFNPDIDAEKVSTALVPLEYVLDNATAFADSAAKQIIFVESDAAPAKSAADAEGLGLKLHPLEHPSVHTSAALACFEAFNEMRYDAEAPSLSLAEAVAANKDNAQETHTDGNSVETRQGGNFTPDEEKQLWELFSQRFDDISANSPSKLEEDEASTVEGLFRNDAYTFIFQRNINGVIDACTFLTDRREEYSWVSAEFLDEQNKKRGNAAEDIYEVFVPGIAAYRKAAMRASVKLLDTMSALIAATNHEYTAIRFECTDVSSLYVPRLVKAAIDRNEKYAPQDLTEIGRKSYYALEIN